MAQVSIEVQKAVEDVVRQFNRKINFTKIKIAYVQHLLKEIENSKTKAKPISNTEDR